MKIESVKSAFFSPTGTTKAVVRSIADDDQCIQCGLFRGGMPGRLGRNRTSAAIIAIFRRRFSRNTTTPKHRAWQPIVFTRMIFLARKSLNLVPLKAEVLTIDEVD